MGSTAEDWWSVEDLLLDEIREREQDKAFKELLRKRFAAQAKARNEATRVPAKLQRAKRRLAK